MKKVIVIALAIVGIHTALASESPFLRVADNGDGTFTNPVIMADYPDPDIIRVGKDYYMVSSSFTTFPGIPICKSQDLVNWEIIGYAYDELPKENGLYRMEGGKTAYRWGSWAPFIRYHEGVFYIGFNTHHEGFFICQSTQPEGPYEMKGLGKRIYDPTLLFDDDGKRYLIYGANTIYCSEISSDFKQLGETRILYYSSYGSPFEGSHVYKRNGMYYITNTSRGYNGIQLCYRSKNIWGPYESQLISADDMNYKDAGMHQGGWVDTPEGQSWFFYFQDRDYLGRVPVLQPVTWINGWPMVGQTEKGGKASVTLSKPLPTNVSKPIISEGSDCFNSNKLHLRWAWNHIPDHGRWSLSERPGYLRLHASPANDLLSARNTLTQKIVGPTSYGVAKIDVSNLLKGDMAGISLFNIPYYYVGIERKGEKLVLSICENGTTTTCREIANTSIVYLKAYVGMNGKGRFEYSTDGNNFVNLGSEYLLVFTVKTFLGNRYALFCFHKGEGKGGYIDVDEFTYLTDYATNNTYHAGERNYFTAYDLEQGFDKIRIPQKQPLQKLHVVNKKETFATFNRLDFGSGKKRAFVDLEVNNGGWLILRKGGLNGQEIGRIAIAKEDKPTTKTVSLGITPLTGVQQISFCFESEYDFFGIIESFWFE